MEIKIVDLLDCIQDDSVQLKLIDVASVERIKEATMNKLGFGETAHRRGKKLTIILIAAVCTALLMTGAAFAVNLFGLRDLALPKSTETPAVSPTVNGGEIPEKIWYEAPGDRISLQGYIGSDEYNAMAEWTDYVLGQSYDPDGSIHAGLGNGWPDIEERYFFYYRAYTQEMADKLEEIAAKYSLSLHSERVHYEREAFMERVAYGDFIGDGNSTYGGYVYEDGTFKIEGFFGEEVPPFLIDGVEGHTIIEYDADSANPEDYLVYGAKDSDFMMIGLPESFNGDSYFADHLDDYILWPPVVMLFVPLEGTDGDTVIADFTSGSPVYTRVEDYTGEVIINGRFRPVYFTVLSCKKGSLTDISMNIGEMSDWTERTYKTACGVEVSIAQNVYGSVLIFAQLDDKFVTVSTSSGNEAYINPPDGTASPAPETLLSRAQLEAIADLFDFSLLR